MDSLLLEKIKRPFAGKPLKILFVATEMAPFAQAGGLGNVMRFLPLALRKLGQDARVMIPRYGTIDPEEHDLEMEIEGLEVPTDGEEKENLICNVKKHKAEKTPPVYFLENLEYYEKRANVYGYSDDHLRWALLCRGTLEFLKNSKWKPDIIVSSDWQTGLVPNYLKTAYKNEPRLSKITTFFVIHNLRFQGMRDFRFVKETERDSGREPVPSFYNPRLANLNWMLRGIFWADKIVTVSPTYAEEIMTPEFGEGLSNFLKEKRKDVYGVLNGINYRYYNPLKSPHVPVHFSRRSIYRKSKNKPHLQKRLDLPEREDVFMASMVSRFARQKGFDLLEETIDDIGQNLDIQLVFLGDGDARYKELIKKSCERFPEKIGCHMGFSFDLPHLVYAASDAILIPSKFEPCGITQMEAMRYGCVPIARRTGGLADTVTDFGEDGKDVNGFLFDDYDPMAFFTTIVRAHVLYQDSDLWRDLVKSAMDEDFSWEKSAKKYLILFQEAR